MWKRKKRREKGELIRGRVQEAKVLDRQRSFSPLPYENALDLAQDERMVVEEIPILENTVPVQGGAFQVLYPQR